MKTSKKPITLRLAEATIHELADIAKKQGVSQADVITVLIHLYYVGGNFDDAEEWFNIAQRS